MKNFAKISIFAACACFHPLVPSLAHGAEKASYVCPQVLPCPAKVTFNGHAHTHTNGEKTSVDVRIISKIGNDDITLLRSYVETVELRGGGGLRKYIFTSHLPRSYLSRRCTFKIYGKITENVTNWRCQVKRINNDYSILIQGTHPHHKRDQKLYIYATR